MSRNSASAKPHYLILDGLRGVAALLVVIFHLCEAVYPEPSNNPLHHGYLAVDFFFLLSGFVVGYAYDDRWEKMTVWEFFKIRLIRLHPLLVLGVIIGVVGFLLDPFTDGIHQISFLKLAAVTLISFTLLPAPDIRGWSETHPLNGPAWSLLQEYIANILYAVFARKLKQAGLWILVIIAAALLIAVAVWRGDVGTGWSYQTFWIALVRMLFPFFAGLLLFRAGKRIHIPMAFLWCSVALAVLFCLPTFSFNGIYEAACIIIAFPVIVAAGAGSTISGSWLKLCKFFGNISYPIYILHYPFIYIYTAWVYKNHPSANNILWVAAGLFVLFVVMAYAAIKLYDLPVRAWLKKKLMPQ